MSKLKHALAAARNGWHVFPTHNMQEGRCSCGLANDAPKHSPGKHPRTKHGKDDATTDEAQIRKWWKQWPNANIGGRCDGVVVFDVDVRNGKRGMKTLVKLEQDHGKLKRALVQRTGSGGLHIVFAARDGVEYPGKAGEHIEIKAGASGYILLPGSDHESGGTYHWEVGDGDTSELPMAPKWIEKGATLSGASDLMTEYRNTPREELSRKDVKAILNALPDSYLESYSDWYSVVQALHHQYQGDADGRELLRWFSKGWSGYAKNPKKSDAEIEEKWRELNSKSRDADPVTIGTLIHAAGGWDEINRKKSKHTRGLQFYGENGDYDSLPPAFDFIPGTLTDNSIAFIYGAPESGKSFYALHLLCCTALGRPVFGLEVTKRRGLYVSLEGEGGIKSRLKAWCALNGVDALPILYALGSFDILDDDQRAALIDFMRKHEIQFVVIDTLAKAMVGADESTAKEMGPVIDALHQIMQATHACVVAITHTGKDATAGIRGWSGQLGAADTTIEVTAACGPHESPSLDTPRTAQVRKQKDVTRAAPVGFKLTMKETDVRNARGEKVWAPAVDEVERFTDTEIVAIKAKALAPSERTAIEALARPLKRMGYLTRDETVKELKARGWGPDNDESWERTFRRVMKALERKGLIGSGKDRSYVLSL